MATMVSRQPSASDLNSYYGNLPPSPKSPTFSKSHHSRRPSFTSWLNRGSSQAPPSPATKVLQISDPQPTNAYDAAVKAPGALGKGALVVRTPQQAVSVGFPQCEPLNERDELTEEDIPVVDIKPDETKPTEPVQEREPSPIPPTRPLVPRRESPAPQHESPIPRRVESPAPTTDYPTSSRASPIPSGIRSLHTSKSYSHLQMSPRKAASSPLPARNAPLPLNLVSSSRQPLLRSALKPPSPTKSTTGPFLPLLPPPATRRSSKESPSSPLAPFHPVLLSGVPTAPIPPSQVIITLETSTVSQRTTVATLTSRPSRLASYLQALVPTASREPPSADSNFSSLFAAHLAQAGLAPNPVSHSGPIHIFLDRPSAPYAHILTYLRTSPGSTGTLPRAASLALSGEPARVEALCELRDEAQYLELTELAELCNKELRARAPKLRSSPSSSSLRDYKFESGSGSEGRGSGGEVEARLREYRFGEPLKEEAEGEDEAQARAEDVPPTMYEKKGSHAGIVVTVPPRGSQTASIVGHGRALSTRTPSLLSGRTRTFSEARYTHVNEQKTWI